MKKIRVAFDNGVFRPVEPVDLPPGTEGVVILSPAVQAPAPPRPEGMFGTMTVEEARDLLSSAEAELERLDASALRVDAEEDDWEEEDATVEPVNDPAALIRRAK